MASLDTCYTKDSNFVPRNIAGEHILVPIKRQQGEQDHLFVLNPVGGFIWEQLSEAAPVRAVCHKVAEAFTISSEQATADVMTFLDELESTGAIHPVTV
jgi:hypothetical protein